MAAQDSTPSSTNNAAPDAEDDFNPALSNDALDELDAMLDDIRSRNEETPP